MAEKKREWTVPEDLPELLADNARRLRELVLAGEGVALHPNETADAFAEVAAMKHRLGGAVNSVTFRAEIHPGRWVVIGHSFRYESFAPGISFDDLMAGTSEAEVPAGEPDEVAVATA